MKRSLLILILSIMGVTFTAMVKAQISPVAPTFNDSYSIVNDPDYCAGVACTEETDSCCDESMGGGK